jgi:hypothetical protein
LISVEAILTRTSWETADLALSHKLAEEIKYEKEAAQPNEPDFLKAFKAQGVWAVSAFAWSWKMPAHGSRLAD